MSEGAAIPEITEVRRVALNPGDVVVARIVGHLTLEAAQTIGSRLRETFPDNQVVVLEGGIDLDVFTPTADPPAMAALVTYLLTECIDGDFLVGCGRSIGKEGGDVAIRDARPSEVAWWAADALSAFQRCPTPVRVSGSGQIGTMSDPYGRDFAPPGRGEDGAGEVGA